MASNILWNTWITFNVTLCSIFKFLSRGKKPSCSGCYKTAWFLLAPLTRSVPLSTKTLRLHIHSLISYFWGKEILPEHFKRDYKLRKEKEKVKIENREAGCAGGFRSASGILRKAAASDEECETETKGVWMNEQRGKKTRADRTV